MERRRPGVVRDAIIACLRRKGVNGMKIPEIQAAVEKSLGQVPTSSVRSYLNLNTGTLFERTGRGIYRLRKK